MASIPMSFGHKNFLSFWDLPFFLWMQTGGLFITFLTKEDSELRPEHWDSHFLELETWAEWSKAWKWLEGLPWSCACRILASGSCCLDPRKCLLCLFLSLDPQLPCCLCAPLPYILPVNSSIPSKLVRVRFNCLQTKNSNDIRGGIENLRDCCRQFTCFWKVYVCI